MKSLVFICTLLLLSLTACKQTVWTQNGEIPAQYIEEAQKFTGTFTGELNGERMAMDLSLDGNKAILNIDMNSNGLLVNNCATKRRDTSAAKMEIGRLKSLVIDDKLDTPVYALVFKLSHNCKNIDGKEVVLMPSNDLNTYNVYITKRIWTETFCTNPEFKERPTSMGLLQNSVNIANIPRIPNVPTPSYDTCFSYVKGQVKR